MVRTYLRMTPGAASVSSFREANGGFDQIRSEELIKFVFLELAELVSPELAA